MPKPKELREQASLYREESKTEADPYLSQALVSHALALTQLAEKIERQISSRMRDIGSSVDRDPDIRSVQRWSVVNAVAQEADDVAEPLQRHEM
jgi:hypothetical protein